MAFRDFEAARREHKHEPIVFSLRGERFVCVPVAPAMVVFDLAVRGFTPVSCQLFIEAVLEASDEVDNVSRFAAVLANTEDPVSVSDLAVIVGWLVEHYTGRPTLLPPDSQSGPSPTVGRPSTLNRTAAASSN